MSLVSVILTRAALRTQWRGLLHLAVNVVGGHMDNKGRRELEIDDLIERELEALNELEERGLAEHSPKNGRCDLENPDDCDIDQLHDERSPRSDDWRGRRDMEFLYERDIEDPEERDLDERSTKNGQWRNMPSTLLGGSLARHRADVIWEWRIWSLVSCRSLMSETLSTFVLATFRIWRTAKSKAL
ncbi:unnamed protein product [Clonostachys solani]|uniref:Uncharacterized protein n=1 Tax=Clonostachys solani TaxID=160281 RepID=A0A9P0EBQ9_9HYPO|nr:unnamed protein product [Clonostachys solani]